MTAREDPVPRPCRVYWGTHGCYLARGHRGQHRCLSPACGSTGYGWGTWYYGEDAPHLQLLPWIRHPLSFGPVSWIRAAWRRVHPSPLLPVCGRLVSAIDAWPPVRCTKPYGHGGGVHER